MHPKPMTAMLLTCLLALSLIAAACTPGAPQTAPTEGPITIRFAYLTILDALPMLVADKQGYFSAQGVDVELVPVGSAPERDQLIAAGQVDGMINEVLSTILNNQEETRVQVVRFARTATPDSALFRILASQESAIQEPAGLKGVEIGVSNGTIIEYLTDRLLQAEGLSEEEIKSISVPKISDRLALLSSGELKAGVLPDPLASLAIQQGAVNVLDDTSHPEYSHSVITFRKPVIDEHPRSVEAFLAALEEAVKDINLDPNAWKDLLVEEKILPPPLVETFQVPTFVTAGVPNEHQYADVHTWARQQGLLKQDVPYMETINGSLLP
jgi:NitT/TauT family transport system substrate-binding protein